MASLFIMPGGVVLFAGFLGKLSSYFIRVWKKGMQGKGDYSKLSHHVVILGWQKGHTDRMIELIFGDVRRENRDVVLCSPIEMDNPFPDKVHFVRGNLTSDDVLHRAGVACADRVIVFRNSDDETLAACLSITATHTKAHIVAWFDDPAMARLLKKHCPEVECHSSISIELLVRSAQDPGSSRLQGQLLSTLEGPTQFSIQIPSEFGGATFGQVLKYFKIEHEAIALGIADSFTGDDLQLNPSSAVKVQRRQIIYYMAEKRIKCQEIDWSSVTQQT